MKNLLKWIGKLLFWVMAAALITYAASRTLDFVNSTLGAEDQIIGYLALFATTGGAIAWLMVFLYNSKGVGQKGISLVMVVVDVLGEITIFTIDTLMQSGRNGMVTALSPEEVRSTVMGMSLLIGLNIIATFAYHIMDADNMAAMEDHFSDWQIELAIQKAKREKATSIANEIAEREADAYAVAQKNKDRSDKTLPETGLGDAFANLFKKPQATEEMVANAFDTTQVELAQAPQSKPSTHTHIRLNVVNQSDGSQKYYIGDREVTDREVYEYVMLHIGNTTKPATKETEVEPETDSFRGDADSEPSFGFGMRDPETGEFFGDAG